MSTTTPTKSYNYNNNISWSLENIKLRNKIKELQNENERLKMDKESLEYALEWKTNELKKLQCENNKLKQLQCQHIKLRNKINELENIFK